MCNKSLLPELIHRREPENEVGRVVSGHVFSCVRKAEMFECAFHTNLVGVRGFPLTQT